MAQLEQLEQDPHIPDIEHIDAQQQAAEILADTNTILKLCGLENFQLGKHISDFNLYLSHNEHIANRMERLYQFLDGRYRDNGTPLPGVDVAETHALAAGVVQTASQKQDVVRPTIHLLADFKYLIPAQSNDIEVGRRLFLINTYLDYFIQEIRYQQVAFETQVMKQELQTKIQNRTISASDVHKLDDAIRKTDLHRREFSKFKQQSLEEQT
ncbi:MAG: hypothetical protein H6765_06185 [Candidatus Peribacteria bacterium]|nr:MAG: hypothetical protein H6765_06185 [Candidatus Peribacteria bacterium]